MSGATNFTGVSITMASDGEDNDFTNHINEYDGLGPVNDNFENDSDIYGAELLIDTKNLIKNDTSVPSKVIIVANLPSAIFHSKDEKMRFESMVRQIDPCAQFQYLTSFKRSRIEMRSSDESVTCFEYLNNYRLDGNIVKCYYVQPTVDGSSQYLELPPREKLFLISPPASPPIGWEVQLEKKPVINHELLEAISKLGKSESYEVFSGNENQPSIIIHVCEDLPNYAKRPPIVTPTRRPEKKP